MAGEFEDRRDFGLPVGFLDQRVRKLAMQVAGSLTRCSRFLYRLQSLIDEVMRAGKVNRMRSPPRSKCFLAICRSFQNIISATWTVLRKKLTSNWTSSDSALKRCTILATQPCSSAISSLSTKCGPCFLILALMVFTPPVDWPFKPAAPTDAARVDELSV